MKQRLALARALLHEPRVLFLDEPTAGLDPEVAGEVRGLIRRLGEEGHTIFLSTHNLAEAESLCHRIAVIHTRLLALDLWSDDWRVVEFDQRPDCPACAGGRRDFLEAKERGATIIFITHDAIEAEKVIQRVGIMREGELDAVGRPSDLKKQVDQKLRLEMFFPPDRPLS